MMNYDKCSFLSVTFIIITLGFLSCFINMKFFKLSMFSALVSLIIVANLLLILHRNSLLKYCGVGDIKDNIINILWQSTHTFLPGVLLVILFKQLQKLKGYNSNNVLMKSSIFILIIFFTYFTFMNFGYLSNYGLGFTNIQKYSSLMIIIALCIIYFFKFI